MIDGASPWRRLWHVVIPAISPVIYFNLIMGVIGLIFASLLNMFFQSEAMMWAISFIGVLLFAGLTAYDTQRIKSMYAYVAGTDMMGKTIVMGALSLYLDFINMFQFLLSFLGSRD